MTPQKLAAEFLERKNIDSIFGKAPIIAIVDAKLSDKAHRLLTLLSAKRVTDPSISLSYEEISRAMGWSRSKAIRSAAELAKLGYATVTKKHNHRNSYALREMADVHGRVVDHPVDATLLGGGASQCQSRVKPVCCAKCGREAGGVSKAGWCRTCTNDLKLTRKIDSRVETTGRRVAREEIEKAS